MGGRAPLSDSRGIVTLALGDSRYLEMAVDMSLSASEHTGLPVALVADDALAATARERYPHVFLSVTLLPERFRSGRAAKYGVVEASPFEHGIFIDADCWVVGDPAPYASPPGDAPLAFHGEFVAPDTDRRHHGFEIAAIMRTFGLDRYLKCNSGVFAFRRAAALEAMDEALALYRDELRPRLKGGFVGDELALGIVGGRRKLGLFPEPGPMYWGPELARLDPTDFHKPIVHLIAEVRSDTFRALVAASRRRREEAGLPIADSDHWSWKHRAAVRASRLGKLARPFLPLARLLGMRVLRD